MPTIKANTGVITQINVFTVKTENQHALIELLKSAAESVSTVPGWLSASLHRSLDGTRVVNYAQCGNMEAWEAVMAKLRAGGFLERNRRHASLHFLYIDRPAAEREWHVHLDLYGPMGSIVTTSKHLWHEKWRKFRPDWRMMKEFVD